MVKPCRQRQARQPGQIGGDGEDIIQIHLHRVIRILAFREGR